MLTADFSVVAMEINAMLARMAAPAPVLDAIGANETLNTMRRIERTKVTPDDAAWAPWSKQRREERMEKGNAALGLLYDEGNLLHSIRGEVAGFVLNVGSDMDYAADLQYGTERMPARPFLGWSDDDFLDYEQLMIHYIETGKL